MSNTPIYTKEDFFNLAKAFTDSYLDDLHSVLFPNLQEKIPQINPEQPQQSIIKEITGWGGSTFWEPNEKIRELLDSDVTPDWDYSPAQKRDLKKYAFIRVTAKSADSISFYFHTSKSKDVCIQTSISKAVYLFLEPGKDYLVCSDSPYPKIIKPYWCFAAIVPADKVKEKSVRLAKVFSKYNTN